MKLAWAALCSLSMVACDAEVNADGGGGAGGGAGGEAGAGGDGGCGDLTNCEPVDCPADVPADLSACTLPDGTRCRYPIPSADDCGEEYACEPVYPEAGAPSHWVYQGRYDSGSEQGCLYDCAPASCEQGDIELGNSCPEGMFCYEVTFVDDPCGTIVFCGSKVKPDHPCVGLVEDGAICSHPGAACMQESGTPNCYDSYECAGGAWDLIDTQCAE